MICCAGPMDRRINYCCMTGLCSNSNHVNLPVHVYMHIDIVPVLVIDFL